MSVSKWAYTPWKCDGHPCPGDCDHCPKAYEDESDKQTDLISRADAIEAVCKLQKYDLDERNRLRIYAPWHNPKRIFVETEAIYKTIYTLPSAELPKGDLISRADVLKYPIRLDHYDEVNGSRVFVYGVESVMEYVESLPSADAVQTDKLENQPCLVERNYTTEGGGGEIYHPTRQHGEWIWRTDIPIGDGRTSAGYICSNCGKDYWHGNVFDFCPNCGARMKGGDE